MSIAPVYVGIDVSKTRLDIFDPEHGHARIANAAAGIAELAQTMLERHRFVVFEATGHYDIALRRALESAGVPHARVSPQQARDFARAIGRRAKTDPIDASMLAELGRRLAPPPRPPGERAREDLALLHTRRDQLVAMRQQETVRRSEAPDLAFAENIDRHLAWLDDAVAEVETAIRVKLDTHAQLRAAERRLRSVPGVGPVTACTLIALMPELGHRSPKAIAALAGLAPFKNDSGRRRGQRAIRGGRPRVRSALYMAAVTAARSNTRLAAFCRNLRNKGKPAKVALIALAHKILLILNAIMRDDTEFKTA